jgi:asparagine synthase (glutamine-hydrolysing)
VKVALSGDGADELFGSYLPHRLAQPLENLIALKARGEGLTEANLALLKPFDQNVDFLENLLKFPKESERRMQQYIWTDSQKREMFSARLNNELGYYSSQDQIEALYDECPVQDPLNRALYIDYNTMLPNQILPFVDRLSMAHSIEVRPPFLDDRIINLAFQIPGKFKIKDGRVKSILKDAVSDLLTPEIIDRPKEGFVLPMNSWLKLKLKDYVYNLLSEDNLNRHGYLNKKFVHQILEEHYSEKKDHGYKIWNLMMFQVWWNQQFYGN